MGFLFIFQGPVIVFPYLSIYRDILHSYKSFNFFKVSFSCLSTDIYLLTLRHSFKQLLFVQIGTSGAILFNPKCNNGWSITLYQSMSIIIEMIMIILPWPLSCKLEFTKSFGINNKPLFQCEHVLIYGCHFLVKKLSVLPFSSYLWNIRNK